MLKFIRKAVVPVGFAGAYGLSVGTAFMPSEWRLFVLFLAILLCIVTLLFVLVLNKLMLGVCAPGPRLTREQIDAIRQDARKRRPTDFLLATVSIVVSLPIIFLMKTVGSSSEFGIGSRANRVGRFGIVVRYGLRQIYPETFIVFARSDRHTFAGHSSLTGAIRPCSI